MKSKNNSVNVNEYKDVYSTPIAEIVIFETEDVISTSADIDVDGGY